MRNPIDVLKILAEKTSVKGYQFERLYRNLYNPDFYLLAYKNIATSPGSMTTGADGMTIDNMSMARINKIIASLKDQTYQPNPARRTYIAKKNNPAKKRPDAAGGHLRTDLFKLFPRLSSQAELPCCAVANQGHLHRCTLDGGGRHQGLF